MRLLRHILFILTATTIAVSATAQQSSSSSVVRKGGRDSKKENTEKSARVTDRMQQFFNEPERSDADAQWMKIVYRQIDLDKVKNAPLYYPEEVIDGQENLFRIILRLLADGELNAYEYLDGREVFTDPVQGQCARHARPFSHTLHRGKRVNREKTAFRHRGERRARQ